MQQFVHAINVYCDTLTKGINQYYGVPTSYLADPDRILKIIQRIETPSFVKKLVVDNQPLNSENCDATIGLYVTFQLRREPYTAKHKLTREEEAQVESFIDVIATALASLAY